MERVLFHTSFCFAFSIPLFSYCCAFFTFYCSTSIIHRHIQPPTTDGGSLSEKRKQYSIYHLYTLPYIITWWLVRINLKCIIFSFTTISFLEIHLPIVIRRTNPSWHSNHVEEGTQECTLPFFHTDQIIKEIRRWIECMHTHICRFSRNKFLLNYHNVGIAVYWFDSPLDTPEEKPRWMECRFAYIAMRCGTRNLQFATNWLKHKADRFHKWNNQGAKGNRAKAVSHKPLHGGKNRKKWNIWLHWQK